MIPRLIRKQLRRLRRRERSLRLVWGTARWLVLAAAFLALACLADWLIDRRQDTPWKLRWTMLLAQAVLWVSAGVWLLLLPLWRRLNNSRLALWVEKRNPEFEQRLISAVQLNQPGAQTRGMSLVLIDLVTSEATDLAGTLNFSQVADHRRIEWSAALLMPVVLLAALILALCPETAKVLVARQLLFDWDIPRSVHLEGEGNLVRPAGEEIVLNFRAAGPGLSEGLQGELRIDPEGQPSEHFPLEFQQRNEKGEAQYLARVPPRGVPFVYRAWLGDGRLRRPARVSVESQPAIIELLAWTRLPNWSGVRPNGQLYEIEQPRGDILALPGSLARVAVRTQKPVRKATLEILAPSTEPTTVEGRIPEYVSRSLNLVLNEARDQGEVIFDLKPEEMSYRILLEDDYGFRNADPPRRHVRILPDEPPRVTLLPEQFPALQGEETPDDFEVGGIPVPLGGSIRLAYTCSSPLGLGRADQNRTSRLRYRLNDGPWRRLSLKEVAATDKSGPFDPRYGAFAHSGAMDQVEYHAIPSPDPDKFPGRQEGGGRFDFQTKALAGLKVGDRLEFYLEVNDQNPAPGREPGRSETRFKAVVTQAEFENWVRQTLQEESRIRQLAWRQRGIFATSEIPPDELPESGTLANVPLRIPGRVSSTFVRSWQLIGPFPNPGQGGHDRAFPPEQQKTNLAGEYPGMRGRLRWQLHHSKTDKIDLENIFNHPESGVAYAVCWVRCAEHPKVRLATGSDDGLKLWLNRRLVLDRRGGRVANPGTDRELIDLALGWNELLVKVDNITGPWAFYLELQDPQTDGPLRGLQVRLTPPAEEGPQFVRTWQLLGPFPNPEDKGHAIVFPPETDPANVWKEYQGQGGKIHWQVYDSDTDKIDLQKFFNRGEPAASATGVGSGPGVAYALCWLNSPTKRQAVLATGSDDGLKLWHNRQLVLDRAVHREAVPGDDRTLVSLGAGWNEVLVKVDNRQGTWAFFLEVRDPDSGRSLEGLEVRTSPPGHEGNIGIRQWQLIGPFANPELRGHTIVYPPEKDKFDANRDYDGINNQKVRWKQHYSNTDRINLSKIFERPFQEANVAYAACWVRADKARPVLLVGGSDDGIKVWLNRRLIIDKLVFREAQPGDDKERGEFTAGWNEVLVKIDNRFGNWAFYLELRDPETGQPLQGLEFRITPP